MVEWKKLGDLGTYFGGLTGKTKEDFVDGNAKFITYMNVFSNPSLNTTSTGTVRIGVNEKQNKLQKGDILFTGSSETPEEAGMSCVVTKDLEGDYYMNSFCFGIRVDYPEKYNLHYLKYILRSNAVRKEAAKSASGVTRFNISKSRFGKILIPIPSLSEQERIVGILDTFTASIDNIKAQIEQRRKQYEHYRDKLLDIEGKEGVEMKTLGEICDILTGYPFDSTQFCDNGIQLMRGANIKRGYFDLSQELNKYWKSPEGLEKYLLEPHDIIISMDGSLVGRSFSYLTSEHTQFLLVQRVARIRTKRNFKFIYYNITRSFPDYVDKKKTAGAIPHISMRDIASFTIPQPSPIEQQRIVSILDTFEASINNLEAQLEQRQKQYEYYREKLLTFE